VTVQSTSRTVGYRLGKNYGRFRGVIDSLPRLPFKGFTLPSFDPFFTGVFVIFVFSFEIF